MGIIKQLANWLVFNHMFHYGEGGSAGGGQSSAGNNGPAGGGRGGNPNNERGGGPEKKKYRPLVTTTTKWEPPQYIPGVKHNIEGYSDITKQQRTGGELSNKRFNKEQSTAYDAAIASFQRRQKLRLSIPSLPDSEALNLENQKKAAQNRMRGRQGTMLSERETLG